MADRILVLDTETGGLNPETCGVVEIAWIEIDEDLNILDTVRAMINPEKPIDPRASGTHGYVMADVENEPTLLEFMNGRFANDNVVMIAFNAPFDHGFVKDHFGSLDTMCALKLARRIIPDDKTPDYKLQTLMYSLGLPSAGKHNALDDVMTTYYLMQYMMMYSGSSLQELYDLSSMPVIIKKMPFGKHKGVELSKLPAPYVHWLLNVADNIDENILYSLRLLQKKK